MNLRGRAARRLSMGGALLTLAMSLAGCTSGGGDTAPPNPATTVHAPSTADVETVRQQLAGIPGVTGAKLTYFKGSFGTSPATEARLTTDATEQADLNTLLDDALRSTWQLPDLDFGVLNYSVRNFTTGQVATAKNLGFESADLGGAELTKRYGPGGPPSTT